MAWTFLSAGSPLRSQRGNNMDFIFPKLKSRVKSCRNPQMQNGGHRMVTVMPLDKMSQRSQNTEAYQPHEKGQFTHGVNHF